MKHVAIDPSAARPTTRPARKPGPKESERQWWLGATDAGRRGLTIAAVALPLLKGSGRDAVAAAASLALAHRLCSIAKHVTWEDRPDGSDDQSFPSSHSLEACSAATSVTLSSGWSIGLPAYAAAGFVGHGRLKAARHHPRDVIVGGVAGALGAWLVARATGAAARKLRSWQGAAAAAA